MDDRFTDDEIATIRKFFAWIEHEKLLGVWGDSGLTGTSAAGVIVTEFKAGSDYDGSVVEKEESTIPWRYLSGPADYLAEVAARKAVEEAERQARLEAQNAEAARRQEAQERQAYEFLKAKYGP